MRKSKQQLLPINNQNIDSYTMSKNSQTKQIHTKSIIENTDTSQLSKYRYVNFVVFILAALVNSIPTQAFSGINSIVQNKFGYSAIIVTLNTLLFSLLHPIGAFPVNWILDSIGMKFGCILGAVLLIAGVWLRSFIEVNQPALCLIGSALSAFGNMFIMNSPSKLATQWFAPKTIPVVISIAVLATNISIIFGGIIPGLFLDNQSSIEDVKSFFFTQAIIVSVPMLLASILIRENPESKKPQQQNQQKNYANSHQEQKKESYLSTLKLMFTNKEYAKIVVVTMLSYGNMIAFIANLNQMLTVLGYKDSAIIFSYILIGVSITGILSTIGVSIGLKKTLAYRKISVGLMMGNFCSLICISMVICYDAQNTVLVILSACCFGFFFLPTPSVLISYASQSVYPLGQASASGYQYAASQTFGFVLGVLIVTFIKSQPSQTQLDKENQVRVYWVLGTQCFLCLIGAFFAFITKQDLRRHKHHLSISQKHKGSVLIEQEKSNSSQEERQYDNGDLVGNFDDQVQQNRNISKNNLSQ